MNVLVKYGHDLQLHTCQRHSSIVPGSWGWGWPGERPARSHTLHPQVKRTAWHGKAGRHVVALFDVTVVLNHGCYLEWIKKWFPFPWVFEPSLCSSCLLWVPREFLKAPILLSLFPLPSLGSCCLNSIGQCPQHSARSGGRLPPFSSHSSGSPKTKARTDGLWKASTGPPRQWESSNWKPLGSVPSTLWPRCRMRHAFAICPLNCQPAKYSKWI